MLDVATCRAFYEAHSTAASFATLFGASTCACVPLIHTWNRHHLTFAMMVKAGKLDRGWPGCPTCNGEGVDPRIPAMPSPRAMPSLVPAYRPTLDAIGIETSTAGRIGKISCR